MGDPKLPFGKHKGKKLSACDDKYLQWMAKTMVDGDFAEWAEMAKAELNARSKEKKASNDADAQARQFLIDNGIDPSQYD